MKKWLLVICVAATGYLAYAGQQALAPASPSLATVGQRDVSPARPGPVQGAGTVIRLLADDDEGSRHQRFILRLPSGKTLLVAHNIDLAPRIGDLRVGDTVEYSGDYEWNPQGGVVHWTHRDPAGRHADGWLKHDGRVYQ